MKCNLLVYLILLLLIFLSSCSKEDDQTHFNEEQRLVYFQFSQSLTLEELKNLQEDFQITIKEVEDVFGEERESIFFEISELENVDEVLSEILISYMDFAFSYAASLRNILQTEDDVNLRKQLNNIENINLESLDFEGAFVLATEEKILELPENLTLIEQSFNNPLKNSVLNKSRSSWYPNKGYVTCNNSNGNKKRRFSLQQFKWDDPSFIEDETYEHELVFSNRNLNGTFMRGTIKSWASNLPGKYKDTKISDIPKELNYALGSYKTSKIKKNKYYYTYISANKGRVDEDHAKLQGQLGIKVVQDCSSTWCIFSISTKKLIPAWDIEIPVSNKKWRN